MSIISSHALRSLGNVFVITTNMLAACSEHDDTPPEGFDELVQALEAKRNIETCDGIIPVRIKIIEALGNLGDERAIVPLLDVLMSSDETILSRGAHGCQPVHKISYGAAAKALARFGQKAENATPQLSRLLKSQNPMLGSATPDFLDALISIEGKGAVKHIALIYRDMSPTTRSHGHYISALAELGPTIRDNASAIMQALTSCDPSSLAAHERGRLLEVLLRLPSGPDRNAWIVRLLSDVSALHHVSPRAFMGAERTIALALEERLRNFGRHFDDARLANYGNYCGSENLQGKRNYLQGKLVTILRFICESEWDATVLRLRQVYGEGYRCSSKPRSCDAPAMRMENKAPSK